jgi:hypothetical protein
MAERPIVAPDGAAVARLHRGFHGQVLLPDQDGYHTARRVWNAMVDHRPAVIARCADPADVAAAVRFGRAQAWRWACAAAATASLGCRCPTAG